MVRRLVAQDNALENQWLKVDHATRYIQNDIPEWQFLIGVGSTLSEGQQELRMWAQLDTVSLDKIRIVGYLYNRNGGVDSSASINFNIYKVADISSPKWYDEFLITTNGILQSNGYFFKEVLISSLPTVNLDGDTTLMIEGTATRLGTIFRNRVYINHLGVYDSIIKVRKDVDYLDITKADE